MTSTVAVSALFVRSVSVGAASTTSAVTPIATGLSNVTPGKSTVVVPPAATSNVRFAPGTADIVTVPVAPRSLLRSAITTVTVNGLPTSVCFGVIDSTTRSGGSSTSIGVAPVLFVVIVSAGDASRTSAASAHEVVRTQILRAPLGAIVLAGLRGKRSVKDVCREHEISNTLFYSCRDKLLEGDREALARKEERSGERELRPKIRELERALGRKTFKLEIAGGALRDRE